MSTMDRAERIARYVEATVAAVCGDVAGSGSGGRNAALFKAAARCGGLVAAGGLSAERAEEALADAASAAGLDGREARSTIRSGLRSGAREPAKLPDDDSPWREAKRPPATAPRTGARARGPMQNASNGRSGRPAMPPGSEERPPPPLEEVRALWAACGRLDAPGVGYASEPAIPYLACPDPGRELPAAMLAALDLVRLVPRDGPWPGWIPRVGMSLPEWAAVYRLAVPMYDACGELRALRFRAVDQVREPSAEGMRWRSLNVPRSKKALAAAGSKLRGLVIADPMALALLRRSDAAAPVDDGGVTWNGRIVISEGEPDAWTWATVQRRRRWAQEREEGTDRGATWAVLGVIAGSWTPELAERIPDGATVVIRTHADPTGEKYARGIFATLKERKRAGRLTVLREPIEGERDDHDEA